MKLISVLFAILTFSFAQRGNEHLSNNIFYVIGKKPDILLRGVHMFLSNDFDTTILELRNNNANISDECYGCQLSFTVAAHLVGVRNHTFAELEAPLNDICLKYYASLAQPLQGMRLCTPYLKNYGPHAELVSRLNKKTAAESCYHLTYCTDEDGDADLPSPEDMTLPPDWYPPARKWVPPALRVQTNLSPQTKQNKDKRPDNGVLRVAHLTDIHVDEKYVVGEAGKYGEYNCNVPPSTTIKFLEATQKLDPHVLIYTGDSPSHHKWEETLQVQADATLWVAEQLAVHFPEVPVYSTIGNHESFPSNLYYVGHEDTQELHEVFLDAYSELSGFTPYQQHTVRQAGYYSTLIRPGLRVLSFNTNFGYHQNWYNVINSDGPEYTEMITFMRNVLENATNTGEKVILISHHPVGDGVVSFDEEITEIIQLYKEVVILNAVGHMHKDEFRLVRSSDGKAESVQFLSQSANSYVDVNPGVRIYYFDNATLELLDYDQYFLNITDPDGNITLLYKAKEEYDLPDLSPDSLQELVVRMMEDDELFMKFWKYRVTSSSREKACDAECKTSTLCRLLTTTHDEWLLCRKDGILLPTTPAPTTHKPTLPPTNPPDNSSLRLSVTCHLIQLVLLLMVEIFNY